MPVPAVIAGGMPTVSSGSQITTFGIIFGWKITFLVCVASCGDDAGAADFRAGAGRGRHGDDRRDPVRVGARPPVADILEIPHRPGLPGHEGDDLAGVEPRAAAEGDDAVMAAGAEHREAGFDIGSTGFGCTSEKSATGSPASFSRPSACVVIGSLARPASVTSSGRAMPAARQASASSVMRPAPKRMAVG